MHRSRQELGTYGITIHYIEERWSWDELRSEVFVNQMNLGPDLICLLREMSCLPPSTLQEFKEMRYMDQKTIGADLDAAEQEIAQLKRQLKQQQARLAQLENQVSPKIKAPASDGSFY